MKDPSIERWLEERSASFTYEADVRLDDIDRELSHRNQARVTSHLDEDTVLSYGVAIEAGDTFPPVVLYRDTVGHLIVIDGNHRTEALRLAGKTHGDAYICEDLTVAQVRVLTFESNAKHGLPTSHAERIAQAMYLEELGVSRAEAARLLRIPEKRIQAAQEVTHGRDRLRAFGIRANGLSDSTIRRLQHLRSDAVLKAATDLVQSVKMPYVDVNDLVTTLNRQPTEGEQMVILQRESSRRAAKMAATAGGKVQLPLSLQMLERAIAMVDRIDTDTIRGDLADVGENMKMVMLSKTMDAAKKLREVLQ